jgi:outer membrane murein-binding lipoprotein Lpp
MTRRLAIVLVLTGCAASMRESPHRSPPEAPPDEQELSRAYDELRRVDADLLRSDAQAAPDCARVDQLRDNICALAARICQIAQRQPAGSPAAGQCEDGKARCKNAVERGQARGCPKK